MYFGIGEGHWSGPSVVFSWSQNSADVFFSGSVSDCNGSSVYSFPP